MSKFIASLVLLCGIATASWSQTYKTAAGFRVSDGLDLTLQQYITNGWTVEGILHTSVFSPDLGVSVLAEKHHKVLIRNLNFYWGPGFHYYAESDESRGDALVTNVAGLSLIGGVELSLGRINIAADLKPEIHFAGDQVHPFEWGGPAISARYIFAKRERRKLRDWDGFDRFRRDRDRDHRRRGRD